MQTSITGVRLIWLVTALTTTAVASQRMLFDRSDKGYVAGATLVTTKQEFVLTSLGLARDFLACHEPKYKLLKYIVATDEHAVHCQFGGKGVNHVSYEVGRRLYEMEVRRGLGPVAELIAIGDSAVVRWRDGSGAVGRTVVRGKEDPLILRFGGVTVEVLHILVRNVIDRGRQEHSYRAYVRTPRPISHAFAKAFMAEWLRKTGVEFSVVHFGTDAWFLDDPGFVVAYPFDSPQPMPDYEAYRRRWGGSCVYEKSTQTIDCTLGQVTPQ
jgi:hypothetical protein